jgi:hypothetical protein
MRAIFISVLSVALLHTPQNSTVRPEPKVTAFDAGTATEPSATAADTIGV